MAKVLVTRRMPAGGLDALAGHEVVTNDDDVAYDPATLRAAVADVDALMCTLTDVVDADLLDAAPRLRCVATVSVGHDHIDLAAARQRGIPVVNTPAVLDETTADLAFALVLAASRRLSTSERSLRQGEWREWSMSGFLGRDVHGARLGLVGYGRTGRAVAKRATGFEMAVRHHTRNDTGEDGWEADLDALLRWADVVSLHVPLTDATRGLIGARELDLIGADGVLVNTARGPVVDEAALAAALREDRLYAAGLDVYSAEPAVDAALLAAPNLVLLPHVGSASVETRLRMTRLAADGVRALLAGETPPNVVTA